MDNKFVGLIILDGFGLNKDKYGNAIALANPSNFYNYYNNCPSTTLEASGEAVGLPQGVMGNSETGHMNIGAGRVLEQKLQKINNSIKNKTFFNNAEILSTCQYVKDNNSNLHIMGLLSDGGVHSHINHLFNLIDMVADKVNNVYIHCFLDGRDTYADSGVKYVGMLQDKIAKYNNVKIASIIGRYYAMDREQNWERTEKAYKALTLANAEYYSCDPISAINASYEVGKMDEFVEPIIITDNGDTHTIKDYDGIIFFNFRDDRARQITASFVEDKFNKFSRNNLDNVYFCGFSQYDDSFKKLHSAFKEDNLAINLSQVISANNLKQFKIAETTKYAHVTFYLNGGIEKPYNGESRFLIETIKDKPFDETPEMRTREITAKAMEEIKTGKYSFMALNYSNCDMLGHTGNLEATIKSVKIMDEQLKKLVDAIISIDGVAIITADHGNAEMMLDKSGKKLTEHTTSKVPFVVVNAGDIKLKQGKLANIAPTILELLNINKPDEFTATSLIVK